MQEISGLIIKEVRVANDSKIVTVLTAEFGKLQFWAQGSCNYRSKSFSGTRIMCYSRLMVETRNGQLNYLTSSDCIKNFKNVESDITKMSLGCWFLQIIDILIKDNVNTSKILRLVLNCLHYLDVCGSDNDNFELLIARLVFELRLLSYLGVSPNFSSCVQCGTTKFLRSISVKLGGMLCINCDTNSESTPNSILSLLKYIVLCEEKKIFAFKTSKKTIEIASGIVEKFLFIYLDIVPKSYKFMKEQLREILQNVDKDKYKYKDKDKNNDENKVLA